jgi:aryl carrier protein AsbD
MDQRSNIMNELRTLLVENLELEVPEVLQETDRLYEYLEIDSIMVLQMQVYIEEVFHVTLPEEGTDADIFLTVGSLVDFIVTLLQPAV